MRAALLLLVACAEVDGASELGLLARDGQASEEPLRFGFPVLEADLINQTIGVDHDPEVQDGVLGSAICVDYDGRAFPHCYDEHDGSDYILEGGFDMMDAGSAEVIAAAAGVVVSVEQDQYDRCHVEGAEVSCDGHPMIGNHVVLEHDDGLVTRYWHLMKHSVVVEVGQQVACGDVLGLIGSSGYSSMPHLHFEVQDLDGEVIDPYAGPYSQEESLWDEQGSPVGLPGAGCTAR